MNVITPTTHRSAGTSIAARVGQATLLLAIAAGGAAVIAASRDAGPPPGQLLASQCFQCHGTDGRAVGGFESVAGKSAESMYKTLLEMSRRRPENIMDLQARAFTPDQLRLIAEYLSTLPEGDGTDLQKNATPIIARLRPKSDNLTSRENPKLADRSVATQGGMDGVVPVSGAELVLGNTRRTSKPL